MKVRNERPTLIRLTRLGFVNAYLVREDDGLTLVDTMLSGSAEGILAAAQALGTPITRIVLTHAHGDHAGSLDALAQRLPGAEIAISAREARLMAGDRALLAERARLQAARRLAAGRDPARPGSSKTATASDRCGSSPRRVTRRGTSRCSTSATPP